MKIPSNLIKTGEYTIGGKYMYAASYKIYQGYYYEINNKVFAGKEFNINAPELVKINSAVVNTLLTQVSTYTYGKLSKSKINTSKIKGIIPSNSDANTDIVNFYCKKLNVNPILIKQIDEQTYLNLKTDPLYIVTYTGNYKGVNQTANDAYKQIPELETWLLSDQRF
jgi:hypothetical protein